MKNLLILLAILVGHGALAKEIKSKKYSVKSSVRDESLSMNEAAYTFIIQNDDVYDGSTILYSVDRGIPNISVEGLKPGVEEIALIGKSFSHKTTPGKHRFVLQLRSNHKELKTRSIEAKGGYRTTVIINFKSKRTKRRRRPIGIHQVKKPIIYLYPEEQTDIFVQLNVQGELTFSYPSYEDGWKVSADEHGTITHNDSEFNYLFWEADQEFSDDFVDQTEGFVISGKESTAFLEKRLTEFGFNGKERADFITFWAPMMVSHENIFVHFKVNQDCDAFAELTIVPTPDEIARFYILWSPIDEKFDRTQVKAQKLPTMNREGFTVLEWGGSEINLQNNQSL
ncbi:MAG: hypothetical protein ACI837_001088 [Crocinitomicaceae bacterium]|jgi:hypothetical protein